MPSATYLAGQAGKGIDLISTQVLGGSSNESGEYSRTDPALSSNYLVLFLLVRVSWIGYCYLYRLARDRRKLITSESPQKVFKLSFTKANCYRSDALDDAGVL